MNNSIKTILCSMLGVLGIAVAHAAPVAVKTVPMESVLIYPSQSVPAELIPLNKSVISAEITGNIESIPVNVGCDVTPDTLLLFINCRNYDLVVKRSQASQQAAKARLDLAEKQLARMNFLLRKKTIGKDTQEQAKSSQQVAAADLAMAENALKLAKLEQQKCAIRSPFHGVVLERTAQLGSYVTPGTPLFTLLQTNMLEVRAEIQLKKKNSLLNAKQFYFVTAKQRFPVGLHTLVAYVEPTTQSQTARFLFENIQDKATIGTRGRITWQETEPSIPAEYLLQYQNKVGVFVAINNKAKFIPLPNAVIGQAGVYNDASDAALITEGRYAVEDGTPIKITR
jgi:RND family efflux transporter MFP subunit